MTYFMNESDVPVAPNTFFQKSYIFTLMLIFKLDYLPLAPDSQTTNVTCLSPYLTCTLRRSKLWS